ncbi:MAG TPA: T9SS type A sorting domain-containing protein [Chryseosolibacter sp.]
MGIEDLPGEGVELYPNPSTTFITLRFTGAASRDLFLYNGHGTLIDRFQNDTAEFSLDVSTSPRGIYLIKIVEGRQVAWKKVIID